MSDSGIKTYLVNTSFWHNASPANIGLKAYLVNTGFVTHAPWVNDGVREEREHMGDDTPRLRILLSYHYYKDADLDNLFEKKFGEPYPELFVDSGAFSAASQGAEVNLKDYEKWLRRWSHWIGTYANLDVIGNAEGTWRNQEIMEDHGFLPLPVFHFGNPWEHLERYIEQYAYIALGGLVPVTWQRAMPWMIRCFKMAAGRSVYHGFGVSSWEPLLSLPFYSVDASSWTSGVKYGSMRVFDPIKGRWYQIDVGDVRAAAKHAKLLRTYGVEPGDVGMRSRYKDVKIVSACALSWVRAEQWLRKRHGLVYIPDRSDDPGLKINLLAGQFQSEEKRIAQINEQLAEEGIKAHLAIGIGGNSIPPNMSEEGLKAYMVASNAKTRYGDDEPKGISMPFTEEMRELLQAESGGKFWAEIKERLVNQPGAKVYMVCGAGDQNTRLPFVAELLRNADDGLKAFLVAGKDPDNRLQEGQDGLKAFLSGGSGSDTEGRNPRLVAIHKALCDFIGLKAFLGIAHNFTQTVDGLHYAGALAN